MPKLHRATLVAALVVAAAFAPAQSLHASLAPSESAYGGGVALAIGALGLAVRFRRR